MDQLGIDLKAASRELDDQGFFVWRGFVDEPTIDRHLLAFEKAVPTYRPVSSSLDDRRQSEYMSARQAFFTDPENFIDIALNDRIVAFANIRFDGAPAVKNIGTSTYSPQTHIHADNANSLAPDPWEKDFRVWTALEDIDPRSGPLYLFPESHRRISTFIREEFLDRYPLYLSLFTDWPVGRFPSQRWSDWYHQLTALTQELVDAQGLPKMIPALRKGDAIVFHGATVHGTEKRQDDALTRKSMIFNVFQSDSPFYAMHAYWGQRHDLRCPENALHFKCKETRRGLVIDDYTGTIEAYYGRAVTRNGSGRTG